MERIKQTDVSKLVRGILKKNFPGTKFSVRTKTYTGGSSIDVSWTNGVSKDKVEKLVGGFHGAEFDGMQDLKLYNDKPYSNDFIFCERTITDDVLLKEAQEIAKDFGHETNGKSLQELLNIWLGTQWLNDVLYRELRVKDL